MPSTIHISENPPYPCVKKTFRTLQTHTNWIDGTHEARNKHYHQPLKAARSVEGQTANGPAKAHHPSPGKTVIEDTARKTEDHQVSTDLHEEAMIVEDPTSTDLLRHLPWAKHDDQTGVATAQIGVMEISPHPLPKADTHSRPSPATALIDVATPPQATHIFPVTALMVRVARENLMTVRGEGQGILGIRGKGLLRTGIVRIRIGIGGVVITGTLAGRGGMAGRGVEVPKEGTGRGGMIMRIFTVDGRRRFGMHSIPHSIFRAFFGERIYFI
jgi:hypothetical protein